MIRNPWRRRSVRLDGRRVASRADVLAGRAEREARPVKIARSGGKQS